MSISVRLQQGSKGQRLARKLNKGYQYERRRSLEGSEVKAISRMKLELTIRDRQQRDNEFRIQKKKVHSSKKVGRRKGGGDD